MIEIESGITIGTGIEIGDVPVLSETLLFVTESGADYLITQDGNNFVEYVNV
jgi:hypothetical protein